MYKIFEGIIFWVRKNAAEFFWGVQNLPRISADVKKMLRTDFFPLKFSVLR